MKTRWLCAAALGALILTASAAVAADATIPPELASKKYGTWGFDLAGRDTAVRPADNFFEYANGGYLKTMEIPADQSWYGVVNTLRDLSEARVHAILEAAAAKAPTRPAATDVEGKVGAFYKAFMDEKAIEAKGARPLAKDLADIRAVQDRRQMAALMGTAPYTFQGSLFNVGLGADDKDTDRYAVFVYQGGLGLPDRDYYLQDSFAPKKQAYEAYVAKMLGLIGWANPAASAKAIVDFETKVAEASWTRAQQRDPVAMYKAVSLAELNRMAPGFDWSAFMSSARLGGAPRLVANTSTALPKIAAVYAATPVETLKAYAAFHLADNAANVLSSDFVNARFDFQGKTLNGQPALAVRWKRGVRTVSEGFGEAIGQVYVAKYFPPDAKAKMADLVQNLKTAYAGRIRGLPWMGPETKAKALAKLAAFDVQIGYPPKWKDYSKLEIRADDLYGDVERSIAWKWAYDVARINDPVDRQEWVMTPQTVNAYNMPNYNQVVFPAAILQAPSFDPDADAAVNYGAIGAVIGHEMGHGFDDSGRQFDAHGLLSDWWTAQDAERFKASSSALGAQYEAVEILPGARINGQLTMGENIADLGGILAALDAYHASLGGKPAPVIDGLTGDQRFFLAYAQYYRNKMRDDLARRLIVSDPHSPDLARVNVVLPNVDAFYEAFNVKPGDKMYLPPEKRVRIW